MYASYPVLKRQFHSFSNSNCLVNVRNGVFTLSSFTVYIIPLYELLINPCLRNQSPSILQTAGIGAAATICASMYGIMMKGTRQVTINGTIDCLFSQHPLNKSSLPFYLVVPFSVILGITFIALYKARIKLVCAQAPYNMNSFLMGLSFMLYTVFKVLGLVFHDSWSFQWFGITLIPTCGICVVLSH